MHRTTLVTLRHQIVKTPAAHVGSITASARKSPSRSYSVSNSDSSYQESAITQQKQEQQGTLSQAAAVNTSKAKLDTLTQPQPATQPSSKAKLKTLADRDEELRRRMAALAGDGGEAGIEYENGVPVAMKRSVRNNMFRYI